jgi:NADH:ubiquinone oxidoreductase subunit 5 (subunit L)/multisubunit Na+/H+ antiporter MnhA subunit
MENYPSLVTLIIIIPLIGMVINLFWGSRLGERISAIIGSTAALLSFGVAVALWSYLVNSGYQAAVVNPPFLDGWIRIASINLEIPWQMRVDTLSVTMMLVVTGVGSLIHIYAAGYMHGDERFSRFFTYLNLFLVFMLILVTGNNFLMMFVGWEGVGLCSFLLIGFWFDKPNGVGWKNSLAARKAMILNRIGDFGMLMGIFLIFWTFGTLDYYRPGEIANPDMAAHAEEHAPADTEHAEGAIAAPAEGEHGEAVAEDTHGEAAAEDSPGAAADDHAAPALPVYTNNDHIQTEDLGVFGQAERMLEEGRVVDVGPLQLPIETMLVLITLFLLLGATGKSAQIPLFVWLPDAMAGPTPVSALIHAATMVTAGVYMMVRSNVFYYNAPLTSLVVAIIGASTAIMAGYVALGQWDIKRVLAYSTISQLGFMVAAVGVGAYSAAMFHLVTHAFFKALLFLGSGSVIHGMEHGHHLAHERTHGHGHDAHGHDAEHHDEAAGHIEDEFDPQDMRNMGGLAGRMPITYITYLIGTLALAGIFPFAGFWSKDEILADSWLAGLMDNNVGGYIAFALLLLAAGFTAFYMWRQMELVFYGQPRTEAADHAPESAPVMTIVLLILGVASIFVGFINTPSNVLGLDNIFGAHRFTTWLEYSVSHAHAAEFQPLIAIGALLLAIGAIFLARSIYGAGHALTEDGNDPLAVRPGSSAIWSMANARLYWDETYNRLFERPFNALAGFLANTLDWAFWHDYFHNTIIWKGFDAIGKILARGVDLGIIDGVVNGIARVTRLSAGRARRVQTGYVRTYAVTLLLGVVIVLVILLLPFITSAGQ